MSLTLVLAEKIAGLTIYIALGFLSVRSKLMTYQDSKALGQFALWFLTPCAMVNAFQYPFSPEKLAGLGVSLLGSLIVVVVFALLTAALRRAVPLSVVDYTTMEYPNAGNFMLPLIASAMGGEWVIYLSAAFFVMNLLMFTHGQAVLSGQKRISLAMFVKNPVLIAVAVGIVMWVCSWHFPGLLGDTVTALGSMMGPVYMFTIGMILGSADLMRVFGNKKAYLLSAGRLLLYPIAAIVVLRFCGVMHLHPQAREILTVVALTAGAPSAVMVVQFSTMYRSEADAQFASAANILSTVLSLLTIPAVQWFYDLVTK